MKPKQQPRGAVPKTSVGLLGVRELERLDEMADRALAKLEEVSGSVSRNVDRAVAAANGIRTAFILGTALTIASTAALVRAARDGGKK